ncbi:hypothetical protein C5167_005363 [Papaver somniferum]|uniref:Uncharacterized protein n=1 Tax=Papaver somniferum TaxID=3469 RepID=A0A4Y7JDD5_PAPSO|nr:hypothetical protein C5167_005363 [Papaver somniferum]
MEPVLTSNQETPEESQVIYTKVEGDGSVNDQVVEVVVSPLFLFLWKTNRMAILEDMFGNKEKENGIRVKLSNNSTGLAFPFFITCAAKKNREEFR